MTAGGPRPIWCHGASAGDMRALDPLVRALAADHPVVLSAWTRTGREMARRLHPGVPVVHPPIDVPPAPRLALRARRPRLLVLEYLELWPAWITACRAAGVPVAVVDGRVTGKSLRARMVLRRAAGRLSLFCAQTEGDAERAVALGVRPEVVRVHGNGKHDGVPVAPPRPDDALRAAVGDVDVVVGSLHPDEEGDALTALAACGLRALVAPRYPQRTPAILRAAARLGVDARARSGSPRPARWVVLDTVGELAAAYALGRVAIVGGTFGGRARTSWSQRRTGCPSYTARGWPTWRSRQRPSRGTGPSRCPGGARPRAAPPSCSGRESTRPRRSLVFAERPSGTWTRCGAS